MTTNKKTDRNGKTANERARQLLADCREELRTIAERQLVGYGALIDAGRCDWCDVSGLATVLRLLREVQGKE